MSCFDFTFLRRLTLATVVATTAAGHALGASEVDAFRVKMEKWVETRQILSEEKSGWDAEREMLRATQELLRTQKQALEEEIATLDASITEADAERVDLLLRRGEYKRSTTALEGWLADLETRVRALVPRLPEPLQRKLDTLLVQIPDVPEESRASLGQRLVNVLGVILQAEKWNATATLTGETRAVGSDGGQRVQVRTLYWGLGQAVYVDSQGRTAGVGRPGPAGWVFTDDPDLADDARLLLDIYEGNVDAIRFVDVPVEIR